MVSAEKDIFNAKWSSFIIKSLSINLVYWNLLLEKYIILSLPQFLEKIPKLLDFHSFNI